MAAFNPLSMLAERTCAPIYNAIDTGNSILAIRHADKILASQPSLSLASALKTIALIQTGKQAEAGKICDVLLTRDLSKNGDDTIVSPLSWSLSRLGRGTDEVALLERACKAQPANEDLARQAIFAMIKHRHYQKAQQTCFKLHKSFDGTRKERKRNWQYFWWSIQSYILLSRHPKEAGAALALPLCDRMISNHVKAHPIDEDAEEELALQLAVMIKQGKKADAFATLSAPDSSADKLCRRSLSLEFLRGQLAEDLQEWSYVRDQAEKRIENGSRNWAYVLAFIKASVKLGGADVERADRFVEALSSSSKDSRDRTAQLARLELLRAKNDDSSSDECSERAESLAMDYFQTFGTKACCHEDLLPYLSLLSKKHRSAFSAKLEASRQQLPIEEEKGLRWSINISKLQRSILPKEGQARDHELKTASLRMQEYLQGLEVGKSLPNTEMQPADDLALLASHSLLSAYRASPQSDLGLLHQLVAFLEFACGKSQKGYQLRMLLVRCYLILGCFDRASIHYNLIGIKAIQNDTLSHLLSDRASSAASSVGASTSKKGSANASEMGFKVLVKKAIATAEEIYEENRRSTPSMVVKCLEHGTFSRVEEFVEFGEAIERSIQHQSLRVESVRTKTLNLVSTKLPEPDRQRLTEELATIIAAVERDLLEGCHDQRDFGILSNLQPLDTPSIIDQTALGPRVKSGWLKCMCQLFNANTTVVTTTEDAQELTESEREVFDLVSAHRSGTAGAAELETFFDKRRQRVSSLVTSLLEDQGRPFDLLHTATTTLEGYGLLLPTTGGDLESVREMARSRLAEMATLFNHASRNLTEGSTAFKAKEDDVLAVGLAALGKDKVESVRRSAAENWIKSLRKVLDATRDALRQAA